MESNSGRLAGKVAVVTGGASGMGKATVMRFCEEGAHVVAADINQTSGESLMDEASDAGVGSAVRFVRTDVSDETQIERAVSTAVDQFGRLDVMFNNAGVGGAFGPITDIEVDDWDYTFDVLVRGVFLGTKHAARVLVRQGNGGSIINTASVAGLVAGAGPQAYSSAKAAVINLTRVTAVELAPARIRVNAICPGVVLTPLLHQGHEEQMRAQLDGVQPWPDHGRPEDIASMAQFLADDGSVFVTGQAIAVDGGLSIAGADLGNRLGTRPGDAGLVGVNRGTTGARSEVRSRVPRGDGAGTRA